MARRCFRTAGRFTSSRMSGPDQCANTDPAPNHHQREALTMAEKKCSKCGEIKPFERFYRMKARKDGYGPWCKSCMDSRRRLWAQKNPERDRALKRAEEKRNQARRNAYRQRPERKAWQQRYSAKWYLENRDRLKAIRAAWHSVNYLNGRKAKMVQNEANRRARRKSVGGTHALEEVMALYQRQRGLCSVCTTDLHNGFHRDHIVPLANGGTNDIKNIQLLCPSCNREKGPRSMEWLITRRSLRQGDADGRRIRFHDLELDGSE